MLVISVAIVAVAAFQLARAVGLAELELSELR